MTAVEYSREDFELGELVEPSTATVPHSREAEQAVLGAVLIDPDQYQGVVDLIMWDDFYIERNKWVFQSFVELDADGTAIDVMTVMDWLVRNGYEKEVEPSYLTMLINAAPVSYNAAHYAAIVHEYSLRRQYIKQANEIAALAYDTKLPIEEAVGKIEEVTSSHVTTAKRTWVTAVQAADEMLEHVLKGKPVAVQTGIPKVDENLGGIPIAALSLLVGDATLGKTALLYQIAQQVNFAGHNVLYVTLEEAAWRLVSRTIFTNAKVDKKDWRMGTMTPVQLQDIETQTKLFKAKRGKLFIDSKSRTVSQICRSVRQTKAKYVVVDDLRHVRLDYRRNHSNDTSVLLDVAVGLKDIAIDEECALTAIHHVTKDEAARLWNEDGKADRNVEPSIDSLTWAGDLRYTIDQWMFLAPDFKAKKGVDVMKIILWLMKDKEIANYAFAELLFDRRAQWFYDTKTKPLGMYENQIYKS